MVLCARWAVPGGLEGEAESPGVQEQECQAQDQRLMSGEAPGHPARQRSWWTVGGHWVPGSGVAPVPAARAAGQGHLPRVSGRMLSGNWGGLRGARRTCPPPWGAGQGPWCLATGGVWVRSCREQEQSRRWSPPSPQRQEGRGACPEPRWQGGPFPQLAWWARGPVAPCGPPSLSACAWWEWAASARLPLSLTQDVARPSSAPQHQPQTALLPTSCPGLGEGVA